MSFEVIEALLAKHGCKPRPRLPDAREIRIAAAKQVLKKKHGRGWRVPRYAVETLHREYEALGTTRAVASVFGMHHSAVQKLLRKHGMPVCHKTPAPVVMHGGVKYTRSRDGFYRQTTRGCQHIHLHRVLWAERHGPVPAGMCVVFLTANREDFSDTNIVLMTRRQALAHSLRVRWGERRAA